MGNRYQKSMRSGGAKSDIGKSGTGMRWGAIRARLGLVKAEEQSTFKIPDLHAGYQAQSYYEEDDDGRILRHRPDAEFNPSTGTYITRNSEAPRRRKVWPWIVLAFAAICLCYVAFNRNDPVKDAPTGSPPVVQAMANTSKPTDNFKQNAAALNAPTPSPSMAPAVIITSAPSPTPTPTPVPAQSSSVLKYGSKGDAVKTMQTQLIELGYITLGKDDGAFGDGTLTAVKSFQKENGLESDGIAGEKTLALLSGGTAKPDPDVFVWVDNKGKVYHSKEDCSDMKDPKQIKLSQAEKRKLTPCEKCH
jgi:hypothetical protein